MFESVYFPLLYYICASEEKNPLNSFKIVICDTMKSYKGYIRQGNFIYKACFITVVIQSTSQKHWTFKIIIAYKAELVYVNFYNVYLVASKTVVQRAYSVSNRSHSKKRFKTFPRHYLDSGI